VVFRHKMSILVSALLVVGSFALSDAAISCKNMQGKDVDWFMAYKLPSKVQDSESGRNFAYLDKFNPNWTISTEPIESLKSAIGATVGQVYDGNDKKLMYAMYNDDAPNTDKTEGYRGHIKGVIAFDSNNGFWIQHSMPNYPPPPTEEYSYPETATKYGQTLICMSMKTSDLNDIVEQLRYMMINAYSFNIPEEFNTKYENLTAVVVDRTSLNTRKEKEFTSKKELKTAGGQQFISFAKHKQFKADLWRDWIAEDEKVDLSVETWLNGAAKNMDSTCSPKKTVLDISSIDLNGNSFKSSKDHSKWGISNDSKKPLICVGDVNRQESQTQRGGGALCIEDSKVWKSWNGIIDTTKPC
ncbi:hypothetical protein PFISCL1PPCAC_24255, partial [Pristionchus fissidentatus]